MIEKGRLTTAQRNALLEILDGYCNASQSTLDVLERKGFITHYRRYPDVVELTPFGENVARMIVGKPLR